MHNEYEIIIGVTTGEVNHAIVAKNKKEPPCK